MTVGYACSGRGIRYQFLERADRVLLSASADGSDMHFHVLLPRGAQAQSVRRGGQQLEFRTVTVEESTYVDFDGQIDGDASFEIALR